MGVLKIGSQSEYEGLIRSPKLSVVVFTADWAEQCQQILNVMAELSSKFGSFQFIEIPAEEYSDISSKHQIDAVPTVIFFRNNKALDRIDGVDILGLSTKCKTYADNAGDTNDSGDSLEDRLKALINKSKVMVFMKGDRNTPRCGFSKTLIQLLNTTGVAYETFDILQDEEVRQGLKTYSDWPTYPQVYVNGELIGGLDIIKELNTSGELMNSLNGE